MRPPAGAFVEAGDSQLSTDGISITFLAADPDSIGGGSESCDIFGGGAGIGGAIVIGGGETELFVASVTVSTGALVAKAVTFVPPSSGSSGSGGHPKGRPTGAGG